MSELLLPGILRTIVPAVMGAFLTMLASRWGIGLTEKATVDLTAAITAIVTVGYYVVIRIASQRFNMPGLEKLLGSGNAPLYLDLKAKKP